MYTTNDDNPQSIVSPHTLLGAQVSFFSPDWIWSLPAFGENQTDTRYYAIKLAQALQSRLGVQDPATGRTLMRGYVGAPLTAGVRIGKTF
jgi:iron complex outermembrane receptor protein